MSAGLSLFPEDEREIILGMVLDMKKHGYKQVEIGKVFGLNDATVSRMIHGRNGKDYIKGVYLKTAEHDAEIEARNKRIRIAYTKEHMTQKQIATMFGISETTVQRVLKPEYAEMCRRHSRESYNRHKAERAHDPVQLEKNRKKRKRIHAQKMRQVCMERVNAGNPKLLRARRAYVSYNGEQYQIEVAAKMVGVSRTTLRKYCIDRGMTVDEALPIINEWKRFYKR